MQEFQTGMQNDNKANVLKVSEALHAYRDLFLPIVRQLEVQGYDTATIADRLIGKALAKFDEAEAALNLVDTAWRQDVESAVQQQAALVHQVELLFAVAVVLGLLLVVPVTLVNMRSICHPIDRALQFSHAIARGDLTDHGIDTSGNDEAAGLLKSLEVMRVWLDHVVGPRCRRWCAPCRRSMPAPRRSARSLASSTALHSRPISRRGMRRWKPHGPVRKAVALR